MFKKLLSYVKEYKTVSFLTPLMMAGEVVMEIVIPLVMAKIIDNGLAANDVSYVVRMGVLMIVLALVSLFFGVMGGFFGAKASAGFAKNLRQAVYEKVQTFSFSNIDKFQTSSLITRMTTDIVSIQNSYQMMLRMGMRAPLTMIFSPCRKAISLSALLTFWKYHQRMLPPLVSFLPTTNCYHRSASSTVTATP